MTDRVVFYICGTPTTTEGFTIRPVGEGKLPPEFWQHVDKVGFREGKDQIRIVAKKANAGDEEWTAYTRYARVPTRGGSRGGAYIGVGACRWGAADAGDALSMMRGVNLLWDALQKERSKEDGTFREGFTVEKWTRRPGPSEPRMGEWGDLASMILAAASGRITGEQATGKDGIPLKEVGARWAGLRDEKAAGAKPGDGLAEAIQRSKEVTWALLRVGEEHTRRLKEVAGRHDAVPQGRTPGTSGGAKRVARRISVPEEDKSWWDPTLRDFIAGGIAILLVTLVIGAAQMLTGTPKEGAAVEATKTGETG